ncbi:hypothetical protein D1609_14780 [Leptospira borgpetersenii serovar Hardjo-bovis]|nr:hypothetical protein D1609_14780 [Leptospira borgpetersenii serovar Hardjo-bovis]TQE55096.1 hypothetical protein FFZ95_01765 [Leptospira borgpetersenii]
MYHLPRLCPLSRTSEAKFVSLLNAKVLNSFCWLSCLVVKSRILTHVFQVRKGRHFCLIFRNLFDEKSCCNCLLPALNFLGSLG